MSEQDINPELDDDVAPATPEPEEAAPQAGPAPEALADTDAPDAPVDEPNRPPPGVIEERRKRQEAERKADEAARRAVDLERRLDHALEVFQRTQSAPAAPSALPPEPQAEPDKEPDMNADPMAWFEWRDRKQEARIAQMSKQLGDFVQQNQTQTQRQRQQAAVERIQQSYLQDAQAFKAETPDFDGAYQHYNQSRFAELQAQYPTARDAQIWDHMRQEELQVVARAQQSGRRPAQAVYEMAKHRGYAPPPPVADPAVKPGADAQPPKSLSAIPGKAKPRERMTRDKLADMSLPELRVFMDKNPDEYRRLSRGA